MTLEQNLEMTIGAWGGGGSVAIAVKVGSVDVILADAYFNKHVVESGTVSL